LTKKNVRKSGSASRKPQQPAPFRVARSRTGLGLFAVAPIRKGKFIIEYWGKRLPADLADEIGTKYMFEVNSRWTIDGSDRRNTARYINHSCKPNADAREIRGAIRVYAKKNIYPGDEITYNYGRTYFKIFLAPVGCKCPACLAGPKRAKRKPKAAGRSRPAAAGNRASSTSRAAR
jgi:SET domain-containing protein